MTPFSQLAQNMRSSEIRRLMSLAADPSIISFAGGMPNNSLFPIEALDRIYQGLRIEQKQVALQYSPTSGYPPLLKALERYLTQRGIDLNDNMLLITTGAQQALNLVAKVLLDPDDTVITEYPSFIGALAAFRSYGAKLKGVTMDDEGIELDALGAALESTSPKFVYINTHFHNPAGIIYSDARKNALIDLLAKNQTCLLEDDPYGELYFRPEDRRLTTPIKALAKERFPVCYAGSFSKIFGPGIRLGWLCAPKEIAEKCELAKQSIDACTGAFPQVLATEFLERDELAPYLSSLRTAYARRAELMLKALDRSMPEQVLWTNPRGGFYVWVTLPENIDSTDVFNESLKNGAAFVIGNAFDPEARRNNCFRLAFSHTPEEKIERGVEIVAAAVRKMLDRN